MTRKTVLSGLSAIGALVIAGTAPAQTVGVTGKAAVTPPAAPALPATPAMPATPPKAETPPSVPPVAPSTPSVSTSAQTGATVSGQTNFPVGTVVRDSAGVQIGTVMDPKEGMATEGRVAIRTAAGFITVPASSLRLDGDVAVSSQTAAEAGGPAAPRPQ